MHISKIRSLTLDVRVWEPNVLGLFQKLGNTTANQVWEGKLQPPKGSGGTDDGGRGGISSISGSEVQRQGSAGEDWVWKEGSDSDSGVEGVHSLAAAMNNMNTGSCTPKPPSSAPSRSKEQFIVAKYVKKEFLTDCTVDSYQALWSAVVKGDLPAAYRALVCGADVARHASSGEAAHLVEDTQTMAGGALEKVLSVRGLGGVTIAHAAAAAGDPVMMELLIQWGAPSEEKDGYGRSPLMYAVLHDHPEVAKLLLKRGVGFRGQDVMGYSVVQMMGQKGLGDPDLVKTFIIII